MNVCFCGTDAGFPHHPACPEPLYRASAEREASWTAQWKKNLAALEPPVPADQQLDSTDRSLLEQQLAASRAPVTHVDIGATFIVTLCDPLDVGAFSNCSWVYADPDHLYRIPASHYAKITCPLCKAIVDLVVHGWALDAAREREGLPSHAA